MALIKITPQLMQGKGVVDLPDVPGLTTEEMQAKLDELSRDVIAPAFNANVDALQAETATQEIGALPPLEVTADPLPQEGQPTKLAAVLQGIVNFCKAFVQSFAYSKEQTNEQINAKIVEIGTGDMAKALYDTNGDGIVNGADFAAKAENGCFTYLHIKKNNVNTLTGTGENGKFKATSSGEVSLFNIGGTNYPVKCGEESYIDLIESNWYFFIFDGVSVNFNQGGAALNFKVISSATRPQSPKENTIWINTSVAMPTKGYIFSNTQPVGNYAVGTVWIKTGLLENLSFNALKKGEILLSITNAYQFNGSDFIDKKIEIFQSNEWKEILLMLFYKGDKFISNYGEWTAKGFYRSNYSILEAAYENEQIKFNKYHSQATIVAAKINVDFTNVNQLIVWGQNLSVASLFVSISKSFDINASPVASTFFSANTSYSKKIIDTSALEGVYNLVIGHSVNGNTPNAYVDVVYGEYL